MNVKKEAELTTQIRGKESKARRRKAALDAMKYRILQYVTDHPKSTFVGILDTRLDRMQREKSVLERLTV